MHPPTFHQEYRRQADKGAPTAPSEAHAVTEADAPKTEGMLTTAYASRPFSEILWLAYVGRTECALLVAVKLCYWKGVLEVWSWCCRAVSTEALEPDFLDSLIRCCNTDEDSIQDTGHFNTPATVEVLLLCFLLSAVCICNGRVEVEVVEVNV